MKKNGTAILVGRFQVFEINALHEKMIKSLLKKYSRLVVFITSNPAPSDINPLEWELRRSMFEEHFGDILELGEMPDLPDDRIWSQELDRRIMQLKPEGEVVIFGSLENMVKRYSGKYTAKKMEVNLDKLFETIEVNDIISPRDFRAGIFYATYRKFPTVYPTVDIAVFRNKGKEILLGRKTNELKYRLPGGFSDPSDFSFEDAALRELEEECGEIEIENLYYLGSVNIDDWRYRGSMDSVVTHLFACEYIEGEAVAQDDLAEVKWFEFEKLTTNHFVYEHKMVFELLKTMVDGDLFR